MDDHPQQPNPPPPDRPQHPHGQQPRLQPLLHLRLHRHPPPHPPLLKVLPRKQVQAHPQPGAGCGSGGSVRPLGGSTVPAVQAGVEVLRPQEIPAQLLQLQEEVKIDRGEQGRRVFDLPDEPVRGGPRKHQRQPGLEPGGAPEVGDHCNGDPLQPPLPRGVPAAVDGGQTGVPHLQEPTPPHLMF